MWDSAPVSISADEAMRASEKTPESPYALDEAVAWLQETLAAARLSSNTVWERAKQAGIAQRTLSRANAQLGIKTEKEKDGWRWSLPKIME